MGGDTLRADELDAIYENAPIGLALIDRDLRYVEVNGALAEMNGLSAADHIGRTIHEVVPNLAPVAERLFQSVFSTGQAVRNIELSGETSALPGVRRTWVESISPVLRDGTTVRAALVTVTEITAQKNSEKRLREAMQELTHRTANGLSLVAALLTLEVQTATSAETQSALRSAADRVRGLGLIHRHLYASGEVGSVNLKIYLSALCRDLSATLLRDSAISLDLEDSVSASPDRVIPIGIIVSELITNACKHSGVASPTIAISVHRHDQEVVLRVCNDGNALSGATKATGIGMTVIQSQVAQLYGKLTASPGRGGGAAFEIRFPLQS
jgi:PAS domain S-box-containing protein